MALITIVSATSPGVTTSALALTLASDRPALLAECDPSGGSVRYGLLHGRLGTDVGLAALAVADRQAQLAEAFERHLLDLDGERLLLAGLTDPRQAAALADTWSPLAQMLELMDQHAGYHVIADGGRVQVDGGRVQSRLYPAAVLHRSDVVLLAVRPVYRMVEETMATAAILREELAARGRGEGSLGLLLIGSGYPEREISSYLQAPVLASLPWEPRSAGVLSDGERQPRNFGASMLIRAARSGLDRCVEVAQRRRLQQQYGIAQVTSPAVAGVLSRVARRPEVSVRG